MSGIGEYAYINTKVRARLGVLRQNNIYEKLIKCGSLLECIGVIKNYGYEDAAYVFEKTGDLQQVELSLKNSEIELYREVMKNLSKRTARFVEALLVEIEVNNLKNAIRLWYSSILHNRSISYRAAYIYRDRIVNPVDYNHIINGLGWDSIIEGVINTPYHTVLSQFDQSDIKKDGLFYVENALDQFFCRNLFDSIRHLGEADRRIARKVYEKDIDVRNLQKTIRYTLYHHMDKETVTKLLYPFGKVWNSEELENYLNGEFSVRRARHLLSLFIKDERLLEESDVVQEISLLDKFILETREKEFMSLLKLDPFTIATILAYFFVNGRENASIRAVLSGKYYGFNEEQIRGLML